MNDMNIRCNKFFKRCQYLNWIRRLSCSTASHSLRSPEATCKYNKDIKHSEQAEIASLRMPLGFLNTAHIMLQALCYISYTQPPAPWLKSKHKHISKLVQLLHILLVSSTSTQGAGLPEVWKLWISFIRIMEVGVVIIEIQREVELPELAWFLLEMPHHLEHHQWQSRGGY